MRLHTKVHGSRRCGLRQDFFMFPYISLCEICDPRVQVMNADIPMKIVENTPSVHLTVLRNSL